MKIPSNLADHPQRMSFDEYVTGIRPTCYKAQVKQDGRNYILLFPIIDDTADTFEQACDLGDFTVVEV